MCNRFDETSFTPSVVVHSHGPEDPEFKASLGLSTRLEVGAKDVSMTYQV